MFKSVAKRFFKGFLAGGIAGALFVLKSGVVITTFDDAKKFIFAVIIGFMTGGFLAVEKAINWTTEPPAPIE